MPFEKPSMTNRPESTGPKEKKLLVNPDKNVQKLFSRGILTINEVRACYGLRPIPDGNKIYQGW